MKVYTPSHTDPRQRQNDLQDESLDYIPPSDSQLLIYVKEYWKGYRSTLERYFSDIVSAVPRYTRHPYETTVVRLGLNGIIIGHKPSDSAKVYVTRMDEFEPPLDDFNLFCLQERLQTPVIEFDFRRRLYDAHEARDRGAQAAFWDALTLFWQLLNPAEFEQLCTELLALEGVLAGEPKAVDTPVDFAGRVFLDEPAGFVREEAWGFEFKHHRLERASAALIRDLEAVIEHPDTQLDILCLVSSGDMTSIGRHIAVSNPKIRVWDRTVLDRLLHKHSTLLSQYFVGYADAWKRIQHDYEIQYSTASQLSAILGRCPPGHAHFRDYEDLGIEILKYLFSEKLGEPKVQSRTQDGVERRDVVMRNNCSTRFFRRIRDRFDADFIIWDFKNYSEPISGNVINDVSTYANPALGRFIVVISREGGNDAARQAQLRRLRNDDRLVLLISDDDLQEMLERQASDKAPEDLLEDLLDELLLEF